MSIGANAETVTDRTVYGDRRWVFGTITAVGSGALISGGLIDTGLRSVDDVSYSIDSILRRGIVGELSGGVNTAFISGGEVNFISTLNSGAIIRWRAYGRR